MRPQFAFSLAALLVTGAALPSQALAEDGAPRGVITGVAEPAAADVGWYALDRHPLYRALWSMRLNAPLGGMLGQPGTSWDQQIISVYEEQAVDDHVRLGFAGHYSRNTASMGVETSEVPETAATSSARKICVTAGARYMFNPEDAVQVFAFAAFGYNYDRVNSSHDTGADGGPWAAYRAATHSVDGRIGVALEHQLIDGVGLRMAAVFVNAYYADHKQRIGRVKAERTESDVDVTFLPSIELRSRF